MEHRFLWFIKAVTQRLSVPILDCYEVEDGKVTNYYSETRQETENSEVLEVLGKIYREHCLIQRLMHVENPPCYFFKDKERESVSIDDLRRYVRSGIPNIQLIQVPMPCSEVSEYTFRLSKGKLAVLYATSDKFKKSVKDYSISSQASTISALAIQCLKEHTHKAIGQIELDFQLDSSNKLWLCNLRSLKFARYRNKTLLRTPKSAVKILPEKKITGRQQRFLSFDKTNIIQSRKILKPNKSRTLSRQIECL